jgi:hypothetical protein
MPPDRAGLRKPAIAQSERRRKETALSIILTASAIQRGLAAVEKSRALLAWCPFDGLYATRTPR